MSDLGQLVRVLDVDDVSKIKFNLSSPYALDNLATLSEIVMDTDVVSIWKFCLFACLFI
jgi:hypothetical protein